MHNFASISPGRSQTSRIELFRLWDVRQDAAYQVERIWDRWEAANSTMPTEGREGLCAARTISGEGWVTTNDGGRQTLGPGSILVAPYLSLTGWGTTQNSWRFYWFEFFAEPIAPLLLPEAAEVPISRTEHDETTLIQSQIRSPQLPSRLAASARFSAMLYHWLEQAALEPRLHTQFERVDRVIEMMHRKVDQQLSVAEMAKESGLSPRAFAAAFEQATGQTPKRYHLNLRLDAARSMLIDGRSNVKQAASQLGFSSAFYLSKLYTKRFGHPPSQAH